MSNILDAQGRASRLGQRMPQQAARVGAVNEALKAQHLETGKAMVEFLGSYHDQMVKPELDRIAEHLQAIDEYIQWQQTPWHKKARMFLAATILKIKRRAWRKPAETQPQ